MVAYSQGQYKGREGEPMLSSTVGERIMDDVRLPDLEVRVCAAAFDVLVSAFYCGKTPHNNIKVVTSIYDKDDTAHLVEVLSEVIKILHTNN